MIGRAVARLGRLGFRRIVLASRCSLRVGAGMILRDDRCASVLGGRPLVRGMGVEPVRLRSGRGMRRRLCSRAVRIR